MNIVFLDIDGVINSDRSFVAMAGKDLGRPDDGYITRMTVTTVDPIAVAIVNKILERADAKIVLSSSHRNNFDKDDEVALLQIQHYLIRLGLNGGRCIGRTPTYYIPRGGEIAIWLENNSLKYGVSNYVILDDHADMLPEQKDNFVQTDPSIGMSAKDYRDACRIFNVEDDRVAFI